MFEKKNREKDKTMHTHTHTHIEQRDRESREMAKTVYPTKKSKKKVSNEGTTYNMQCA